MTTSVACKALHVSPRGQYTSDPVSVIVSQNECVSNEQGQILSSEFSFLEMTEVEYTHLQHIIQSHIEAQAVEQEPSGEIRTNSASFSEGKFSSHHHSGTDYTASSPPVSPSPACQADTQPLSTDVRYTISEISPEGGMDIQEIKMVLVSDPTDNSSTGERTPTSCCEVPGSVLAKVRCAMEASRDRVETCDHRSASVLETRPNPPSRVRLEKRFNCSPCDVSRQQDSQSAALNTLLTMLQHSTEATGIAMHSQADKWIKSDRNPTLECAYPYGGSFFNAVGTTLNQGLGGVSHMHEGNKQSELIIPKNFTFSYRHERGMDATAPCFIRTDTSEAQVCVKPEKGAEGKPYTLKRARTRGSRVHGPGIVQRSAGPRAVASGKPGRRTAPPMESTQRRERHNSKERDRRRRIRVCCDELNLLVPFCSTETDKATTLQWTTAFLKYIREIYGDSLKQDFQSTFCGKTGVRIRPSAATTALHTHQADTMAEHQSAPSHESLP